MISFKFPLLSKTRQYLTTTKSNNKMPLIPAGVDPKITDGIVLFRPFHEDKLYFALVYFNGNPEVGKHYIKDVDITQPMNDADRLTDVKSSLPDLISKGATFVFARVPRGRLKLTLCHLCNTHWCT